MRTRLEGNTYIVFILLLGTVETDSPDQIQPWFSQRYSGGLQCVKT